MSHNVSTYHTFFVKESKLFGHCIKCPSENEGEYEYLCVLSKQCYHTTMEHLLNHLVQKKVDQVRSSRFQCINPCQEANWHSLLEIIASSLLSPCDVSSGLALTLPGDFKLKSQLPDTPTVTYTAYRYTIVQQTDKIADKPPHP